VSVCYLKVGDILYDTVDKDIGILIDRFDNGGIGIAQGHNFYLWVWEIYWTREFNQYYSEEGLMHMVTSERLIHFGSL
jgi:hypothetical protein